MMKAYIKYFIFMLTIIFIPIKVDALCDYEEKSRLKAIATNIILSIDYVEENDKAKFLVTLTNLHPDIYIKDTSTAKVYHYDDKANNPNEITIYNYNSGITVKYEIYAENEECTDDSLSIKYANFPSYNKFYDDPLCKGIEDYELCQKWLRHDLSYNQFKTTVINYKNKKDDNTSDEDSEKELNYIEIFLSYYINYYIYILSTIIIICLISIYQLRKRDSFNL